MFTLIGRKGKQKTTLFNGKFEKKDYLCKSKGIKLMFYIF